MSFARRGFSRASRKQRMEIEEFEDSSRYFSMCQVIYCDDRLKDRHGIWSSKRLRMVAFRCLISRFQEYHAWIFTGCRNAEQISMSQSCRKVSGREWIYPKTSIHLRRQALHEPISEGAHLPSHPRPLSGRGRSNLTTSMVISLPDLISNPLASIVQDLTRFFFAISR